MVELPKPIEAYIAGSNAHDADACAACFADDAIVRDEGREMRGVAAVRDWMDAAIAKYRQIVDQYPRTATAPLALYHLGNTLVQANELSAAIEAYQRFLTLYSSNPSMAGLVQQRLAYVYLHKGDRDQAMKALTGILETPGTLNRDQALFELARLEESQSHPEGALARYQELIKNYPNSPFTSEATIRTKIMDVKKSQESTPASTSPAPAIAAPQKSPPAPLSSADKKKS